MANYKTKDADADELYLKAAGAGSDVDPHIIEHSDAGVGATGDAAATAGSTGSLSAKLRLVTSQLNTLAGYLDGVETALAGLALESGGNLAAAVASLSVLDDWDESDRAKVNLVAGQAGITAGAGAVGASTPRVTLASDDPAVAALQILDNVVSGSEAQVDVVAALPAGTNAIGKLLPPDVDVTAHTNYAKKYYTSAGAATDGIIWSPAAGKRWHVVSLFIQISAAATITLEDDKAGGDEAIMKMELAANSGVVQYFGEKYPLASGEDAADLLITTTAGNVYVTCTGYEV